MPRLRRPEHTGENRCGPCTVLNLVLSGVLAGIVAVVWTPLPGVAVLAISLLAIYFRGYLVPGTPTITARYFPRWLLRWFGKEPTASDVTTQVPDSEDGDEQLVTAGVLVRDGSEVELAPAFRTEWRERMDARTDVDPEDVRALFDADSVSRHGDLSFVIDGSKSVRWGSMAALRADVAAAGLLRDRFPGWAASDPDRRQTVLRGLRLCLATCPACGGALGVEEKRVDPCCERPHLVAQSVCPDCGAALADAAVVDDSATSSVRNALLQV